MKILKNFCNLVLLITGLAFAFTNNALWFLPSFYFPKPTGQYAVGVKDYHWIDASRKEILANDTEHPNRELMVSVWYPASGKMQDKPSSQYVPDIVEYCKKNEKFFWLLNLSRPIYSYAQQDAKIVENNLKFPAIIFSHGFGDHKDSNTAECQELASQGYIVVGISHTYDCGLVKFPDGKIVDGDKSLSDRFAGKNNVERCQIIGKQIETWISDVQFVLSKLIEVNFDKCSVFYDKIDIEKIGMFGHSFGGATAAQICRRDARVKAGVNLDGRLFGSQNTENLGKPFMLMLTGDMIKILNRAWTEKDWKEFGLKSEEEENLVRSMHKDFEMLSKSTTCDFYMPTFLGARHRTFADSVLLKDASIFSRFYNYFYAGKVDGFRAMEIVNAYLVNFFDKYLKGQPSQLLDGGKSVYPEIEMKIY